MQFAWWVPAWCYLLPATVALCLSAMLWNPPGPRLRSRRFLLLLLCLFWSAWQLFCVLPRPMLMTPLPYGHHLKVAHWNMSSPDLLQFAGTLGDIPGCRDADIISLGVTMPDGQLRGMVSGLGKDWNMRRIGVFAVASRYPILATRFFPLGLDQAHGRARDRKFQDFYNLELADRFGFSRREFDLPDDGAVLEYVIGSPEGIITLRVLDLPSNPFRSRIDIARHAARVIAGLEASGALTRHPHIILGDTNIPRGSYSLSLLDDGLTHAGDLAAETNKGATWPRARPLLEIDHAWVAARTIVDRYETFDAGISDHCGIFFDMDSASLHDR